MVVLCAGACGRATLGDDDGGGGAFAQQCRSGCIDIEDCAPDEFAELFADVDQCVSSCEERYRECAGEALSYFACVSGASCDTVAVILTQGPDGTECGPAFATAERACGR
jgi:hypothetical protein